MGDRATNRSRHGLGGAFAEKRTPAGLVRATNSSSQDSHTWRLPVNASGASVHHQWNSAPPSPQSRRFHSRMVEVTWP